MTAQDFAASDMGAPSGRSAGLAFLLANRRLITMLTLFLGLCVVFHVASGGIFLSPRNLTLLMRQGAIVSIVAMGVAILIIKGEIDLSIGSSVYLCGVAAGMCQLHFGLGIVLTLLVTLAVGLVLGLWQGTWTVALGVPSFVVTLAGFLAFRGAGYYVTGAETLAPMSDSYSALSEGFLPMSATYGLLAAIYLLGLVAILRSSHDWRRLGQIAVLSVLCGVALWIFAGYRGIPNAVIWVAACWVVLWFLMMRTAFGRNAYLIGSNREAARLAGIEIRKHLVAGFLLMGALYAIAGTLMTARLNASTPAAGLYLELDAIAAAVIGGTSLRGGIGTVTGAIAGAALLVTIDNGMSILNISSFVQMMIKGMVLLLALAADFMLNRRRAR